MKLIKNTCPDCGAHLDVDLENKILFCPFCGNRLLIDDESIDINVRYYDEAKVIQADIEKDKYERGLRQNEEDDKYYTEKYVEWKNNKIYRRNQLIRNILIVLVLLVFLIVLHNIQWITTILRVLFWCALLYTAITYFINDYRNLKEDPTEAYRENLKRRDKQ